MLAKLPVSHRCSISNSTTKNYKHFIVRLGSPFKDWPTENATRIQNSWGTEISGFVSPPPRESHKHTENPQGKNILLYFMNKKNFLYILYFLEKYIFFTVKLVTVSFMGQRKRERKEHPSKQQFVVPSLLPGNIKKCFPT